MFTSMFAARPILLVSNDDSPVRPLVDAEARIVHLVYVVDPPFDDWRAALGAALRHPAFGPGFDFIIDRGAVTQCASCEFVRSAVDFIRHDPRLARARWAIIAGSVSKFGMGRMAQILSECEAPRIMFEIFDDVSAAYRWLRPTPGLSAS